MSIKKYIPNSITSLNLLSGCISILLSFEGYMLAAVYLIFLAAIFDFLDGMTARLLKAYSVLGKELDSLADVVSFGVAPAFIVFQMEANDYRLIRNNSSFISNGQALRPETLDQPHPGNRW